MTGAEKGIAVLDAPVSGGDIGARNAALSIMVGGDATTFEAVKPLFDKMGLRHARWYSHVLLLHQARMFAWLGLLGPGSTPRWSIRSSSPTA